jgi:hypothetical protein
MSSLLDLILSFLGVKKPKPVSQPVEIKPVVENNNNPQPAVIISRKVLMVVYDPIVEPASGARLSQKMNWYRVDELSAGFLSDILETSGGLARYQIIQRIDVNEFPVKMDGFRYTPESYRAVLNGVTQPHKPDTFNYDEFLKQYNIVQRVASNEIDEVWIFAFPHAGLYESTMGGLGAFWCNSQPLARTFNCPRRFILMGFSFERGIGEMLESFGHRAEAIMEKLYSRAAPEENLWHKFIRYDKTHPGQSECGNVHFAPNSDSDYDWGNLRLVDSHCNDWYTFPNLPGTSKKVNAKDWGSGEIRAHHKWWLKHFPKASGRTNGFSNNWWQYIIDPNRLSV